MTNERIADIKQRIEEMKSDFRPEALNRVFYHYVSWEDFKFMLDFIEKLEGVRDAAGGIGCMKMGGSCTMVGFSKLKEAYEAAEGKE